MQQFSKICKGVGKKSFFSYFTILDVEGEGQAGQAVLQGVDQRPAKGINHKTTFKEKFQTICVKLFVEAIFLFC